MQSLNTWTAAQICSCSKPQLVWPLEAVMSFIMPHNQFTILIIISNAILIRKILTIKRNFQRWGQVAQEYQQHSSKAWHPLPVPVHGWVCHDENLLTKFNDTIVVVNRVKESGSTLQRGTKKEEKITTWVSKMFCGQNTHTYTYTDKSQQVKCIYKISPYKWKIQAHWLFSLSHNGKFTFLS